MISETELYRYMRGGYGYTEVYDLVHKLNPRIRDTYVTEFQTQGMSRGNIFYKKPSDSGINVAQNPHAEYA